MRIENMMKCSIYYPYAGILPKNGRELKAGQLTGELEPTRFMNPLLQKDAVAGKIKVYLSEADKAVLGHTAIENIKKESNKRWSISATIIPEPTPVKKETKPEPVLINKKEEQVKFDFKPQPLPPIEEIKVDDLELGKLNKPPLGTPEFTQKTKATTKEISQHMGSIV